VLLVFKVFSLRWFVMAVDFLVYIIIIFLKKCIIRIHVSAYNIVYLF